MTGSQAAGSPAGRRAALRLACMLALACGAAATPAAQETAAPAAQETPAPAAQDAEASAALEAGGPWLARCGAAVRGDADAEAAATRAACLAWIEGLLDMHAIYQGLGALDRTDEGFCPGPAATLEGSARVVALYIDARPAAQHVSARMLAYMALREEFPCR